MDTSVDYDGDERKEREALTRQSIDDREEASWIVAELPQPVTSPAYAALEAFQAKKWCELLQLTKLMSAPCFLGIRLAGDDRALYECFFRAFPRHLVTKARFTSVVRHLFGLRGASVMSKSKEVKRSRKVKRDGALSGNSNETEESERRAACLALDRHLERLQFCCERSIDDVLMLNWKALLVALRMFQDPLLTMHEHLTWAFSVFSSSGCLESNDSNTLDMSDVMLIFTYPMRNPTTSRFISDRIQAALEMLSRSTPLSLRSSSSYPAMSTTRITYRIFKELLQLPPLQTVVNPRLTPYTTVFDELSVSVYRDFVFRARRRDHHKKVVRRLRYFNETKCARLCFHKWAQYVNDRKAVRANVACVCTVMARIQQLGAFEVLRRHALMSLAALEIQRLFRGMCGRMRADEAWHQAQAQLAEQGANQLRVGFAQHLRKLRHQNLLAIRIQRTYRGRLGRIQARQRLLAYYYRELAAIQAERDAFRVYVREEMARRLQRHFRRMVAHKKRARQAEDEVSWRRIELEMISLSEQAEQQAARYRREVTERYDKVREEAEYKEKRRHIDDLEKQKIMRRRRQREWAAFKADKLARKEALKLQEKEAYKRLKTQWEVTIAERVHRREELVRELIELEEVQGEWKKLRAQLHQRVKARSKRVLAKCKTHGTIMSKEEAMDRARHEVIAEEAEAEERKTENDWLQAEADYLKKLDNAEEERQIAQNVEKRVVQQKSVLAIQCAFRMYSARKLLRRMLTELYSKEFDPETHMPLYRNKLTGNVTNAKPTGLGSQELEYENHWVLVVDKVLGEEFFYNPHQTKQSWTEPDECQFCASCRSIGANRVFAAVWNSRDNTYMCHACYENEYVARSHQGDLQSDVYVAFDGSRPYGQ